MEQHTRPPVTRQPHSRVEPPKSNKKGLCGSVQCLLAAATRDRSPSVHARETSHDSVTVRNTALRAQRQKGTDWCRRQHGPASQRLPRLKPAEQTAHVGATDPTPQDKGGAGGARAPSGVVLVVCILMTVCVKHKHLSKLGKYTLKCVHFTVCKFSVEEKTRARLS